MDVLAAEDRRRALLALAGGHPRVVPQRAQAALLARTPLGRIGTPEEIAEAVRWLLQDARYCTGQALRVDGGRMLEG